MPEEERFDVNFSPFAVNEKARCYWDTDLQGKNAEFIRGIDPGYFRYLAATHSENWDGGPEERAHGAMAVRSAYHHGTETLFALLFAGLQAPDCVVGWMQEYVTGDLRDLVGSVGGEVPRYLRIRPDTWTWEGIARSVFAPCYGRADDVDEVAALFGRFFSRLAREFLSKRHADEYNSIKHGLRLTPGATEMNIAFQMEDKPGTFGGFKPLIEGKHGHRFYVRNVIARSGRARHLSLRQSFVNWGPEGMCADLGIISVCVHNVRTWLLIVNGHRDGDLTYNTYNREVLLERIRTTETSSGTEDPGLTAGNLKENGFDEEQILRFYGDPDPG